jgi:hypothetical protein
MSRLVAASNSEINGTENSLYIQKKKPFPEKDDRGGNCNYK